MSEGAGEQKLPDGRRGAILAFALGGGGAPAPDPDEVLEEKFTKRLFDAHKSGDFAAYRKAMNALLDIRDRRKRAKQER